MIFHSGSMKHCKTEFGKPERYQQTHHGRSRYSTNVTYHDDPYYKYKLGGAIVLGLFAGGFVGAAMAGAAYASNNLTNDEDNSPNNSSDDGEESPSLSSGWHKI